MKPTFCLLCALAATSCSKKEPTTSEPAATEPAKTEPAKTEPAKTEPAKTEPTAGSGSDAGSGAGSGSAVDDKDPTMKLVDPGSLKTPESVLYDVGRDMYMVSSINGKPTDADDNGILHVVNPDGSNERSNASWAWIQGTMDDIKLDAPKGMAISGDTLFVADINVVRQFEAKPGKQKPDIVIEGATFLNDVVPDGADGVFVTDTGLDAEFKPTGTDAVYHITKDGKVTARIKNKELGGPNGIWLGEKGSVWVVTFRSGEIYEVDAKGKQGTPQQLPKGQLDGIVILPNGDFLVSSWEAKAIYRGRPGGEWKEIISGIESPADFAYDPKRKRVIIPVFMGDKLELRTVE